MILFFSHGVYFYRTRMTRITRITHRYTRVVGKPSVDIPEASTSAARARFVSIRAHLWENILSIWISCVFLLFPTDYHGFTQITHHSARVYHPEGNKQQAARLGRTKVLFCATDAKSRAESSNVELCRDAKEENYKLTDAPLASAA